MSDFLTGARGAYEMILMTFEKGDLSRVRPLLSADVHDAFSEVVAARVTRGLKVAAEFLGIREVSVQDAEFDHATVKSVIDGLKDSEHVVPVLGGFTMYKPNTQIRDKKVNIEWYPKSDFALIALPQVNAWYLDVPSDPSMGTLPTLFPGKYSSEPLTAIKLDYLKIASPNEGAEVVLVGFPRKNDIDPSIQNRLEMRNGQSYSTGTVLNDSDAAELLKTAEGEEKLLPYNKHVEFLVLGSASVGI